MKKILKFLGIFLFWVGIWQILAFIAGKEVLLPSPVVTFATLARLIVTSDFWLYCGASVLRILTGLAFGTIFGSLLAVLTCKSKFFEELFSPLLSIIRATPVASFIILALVWIGRGNVPAFTAFLMVLPVIWNSVCVGIGSIDPSLSEMVRVFRLPFVKRVSYLYIPSVLPSFSAGLRTGLGLAWKAGIAAEVISSPKFGIGAALYDSKVYLNTAELFAWTATVVIISMVFEHLLDTLMKRLSASFNR